MPTEIRGERAAEGHGGDSARADAPQERAGAGVRHWWSPAAVLFGAGLLAIAFGAGMAAHKFRVFPFRHVAAAAEAAEDWREHWRDYLGLRSRWLRPASKPDGVGVHDPRRAWPGHTFVARLRDGAFGAALLDMGGRPLHRWALPLEEVWRAAGYAEPPARAQDAPIHGAALLPGGDIVVAIGGLALARLDACSGVVWSLPVRAHHAVEVLPNGDILTLGAADHADPGARWPRLLPGTVGFVEDGTVVRVSADGRVLEEHSMLDAIYRSGWQALLFAGRGSSFSMAEADPLHLNDVEMLPPEMAAAFPMFEAGDLLVDFRNLQTVAVLDGDDKRIKWTVTGPFFGQHDPDFLPNGRILVYDNRMTGDRPELGHSRLLEIEPATREVVWSYQGTDAEPFYASFGGKAQLLPNGNVLAVEPVGGRVFELARDGSGASAVVWEYVNHAEPGSTGVLTDAVRVPEVREPWLGAACGG